MTVSPSNLIERLRREWNITHESLLREAADEIERLTREHNRRLDESYHASMERDRFRNDNERLRAAMQEAYWIVNFPTESQEYHDRRKNWLHEHADEYLALTQLQPDNALRGEA
jgi:hypothetical protein